MKRFAVLGAGLVVATVSAFIAVKALKQLGCVPTDDKVAQIMAQLYQQDRRAHVI